MTEALHIDFSRNIDKMEIIGRTVEGHPRPVRIILKRMEARTELLSRAKKVKDVEKYKRMFISPDLMRKQQDRDRELRWQLKLIRGR